MSIHLLIIRDQKAKSRLSFCQMHSSLPNTNLEQFLSPILTFLRPDRFIETPTCPILAEWNVSDAQVRQKSENYLQYLAETPKKVEYSTIIDDVYTLYIQHDIERAMKDKNHFQQIDRLFRQTINENDVTHIIRAYTLDGAFFRVLNHHLAMSISVDHVEKIQLRKTVKMHYWEGPLDIATIFACHPRLDKFHFKQGIVFRGLRISNDEDLLPYQTIGNRLLNKTFVSTSQNQHVAMVFAGVDSSDKTSCKGCLFKYTIGGSTRRTALDIHALSQFPHEEEVLLLPYGNFEVVKYEQSTMNPNLVEIELRECQSE